MCVLSVRSWVGRAPASAGVCGLDRYMSGRGGMGEQAGLPVSSPEFDKHPLTEESYFNLTLDLISQDLFTTLWFF